MHVGRSRQDLHGTVRRLLVRDQWVEVARVVVEARQELLNLAEREAATVIPAYTHGVPSQPTTFGHMLLAFSASLGRDFDRLKEVFDRLNLSPTWGPAAGTTSGYAIDRNQLSALLGFNGPRRQRVRCQFRLISWCTSRTRLGTGPIGHSDRSLCSERPCAAKAARYRGSDWRSLLRARAASCRRSEIPVLLIV